MPARAPVAIDPADPAQQRAVVDLGPPAKRGGHRRLRVDVRVGLHAGDHAGHQQVQHRAHGQRAQDAKGTSRCGRTASSAWVEIESKPMYAKNTSAAPTIRPENP